MGGSFRAHSSERNQQHPNSEYRKLSSPKDQEAASSGLNPSSHQLAERLHPSGYRYSHATLSRTPSGTSGAGSGGGHHKNLTPRHYASEHEEEEEEASSRPSILPRRYYMSRRSIRSARAAEGSIEYESIVEILKDFCARTSSHGIPFIGTRSFFGKYIWAFLTLVALLIFFAQTYLTLADYFEYRTIIEMQIRFEPAPFPAATFCNLNAYKASSLKEYDEIQQGLQVWERAMNIMSDSEREESLALPIRRKRHAVYQPVYVRCVCNLPDDQCVPQRNPLETNTSICMCYEDEQTGDIWPCYPTSVWTEKTCFHCSKSKTCDDPERPNITSLITEPRATPCICQSVSRYCMVKPAGEIKWWNPQNYTVFEATEAPTIDPNMIDAFGLAGLQDRGAITTKTRENLIFLIAAMPRETRQRVSYTLDEFVLRCSFNGDDCDLKRDFQIHMDATFGNCYTFNFNDSVELKNSRAGPMYGLRLLLNVNQSDYLPTTEAAGIRLVVHEQDQEPFPDTFGYSAPTGFVSSFGLKTKVLHRLDAPYGKCSDTFRPEAYIYAEHYSPEGCYRNCFQHKILQECGCGDPRFPLPSEKDRVCNQRLPKERTCYSRMNSMLGQIYHQQECHCVQPCTENVFETAYSAAAWPAISYNLGADCPRLKMNDSEACTEYFRVNTAYIEIYYEQLNYETLKETAGYTLVNLFSDFGGNIGLWIGFSVITVFEVIELVCELVVYIMKKPKKLLAKKKARSQFSNNNLPEPKIREDAPDISEPISNSDSTAPLYRRSSGIKKSQTLDSQISESIIEA